MFIISWDSSVDQKLIEDKGIKSFSNYEDMKKYMDELIWEMRFSDLETSDKLWITDVVNEFDSQKRKLGFVQIENSFMEKEVENHDMTYFRQNLYKSLKVPFVVSQQYIHNNCNDLKEFKILKTLEV